MSKENFGKGRKELVLVGVVYREEAGGTSVVATAMVQRREV